METLTDTLIELGLVEGQTAQQTVSFSSIINTSSESFQNASAQLDSVQAAYKSVQSVINAGACKA